ncbi:MAG: hypothetical protein FWD66_00835, partial [Paludibacter sp.]|nr:hypothetical protein [Paludibacter sp.]
MRVSTKTLRGLSRQRRTCLVLCLALLCALLPFRAYAQYSGGNGTSGSPYLISNAADVNTLQTWVANRNANLTANTYFLVTADINRGNITPIGGVVNGTDAYPFTGH